MCCSRPVWFSFSLSLRPLMCSWSLCSLVIDIGASFCLSSSFPFTVTCPCVTWEDSTVPLANVWLCGAELPSCSSSSTCRCSGGIAHFSPFPCSIWECGKRQTAVVLTQTKVQYSPSHSWGRCTIHSALLASVTQFQVIHRLQSCHGWLFLPHFGIFCRNFCQNTFFIVGNCYHKCIFCLSSLKQLQFCVSFGRSLWKSLCAKGELLGASCPKYESIHEERPLRISLGNIPHEQRMQMGSERKSLNLQAASQSTCNIQKVCFLFLPCCLMELCLGTKLFLKDKKS